MRVEFYGISFETSRLTVYLWSPWRASAIEHRMFEAVRKLPGVANEDSPEELKVHITDPKTARVALQAIGRVLKGWQEDAEMGVDRRSWRWMIEGDTNADGYDHFGEAFSIWIYLRLSLDRGSPGEGEKGEDIDLDGFGVRICPQSADSGSR